jgi:hypothetical protein
VYMMYRFLATLVGIFIFYPVFADTWQLTGSMSHVRSDHCATLTESGRVLVTGGRDINGSYLIDTELYDFASETWISAGSMITGRTKHTSIYLQANKVLVVGGYNNFGTLSSSELYDPNTGGWVTTEPYPMPIESHTATRITSTRNAVLVAGGYSSGYPTTYAHLYDVNTGHWEGAGSMNGARSLHTATSTGSKVLVVGGVDLIGYTNSAELYDPYTMTWTITGSMNDVRCYHTATLLPNGKILVTGGRNNSNTLASAEIYDPTTGTWTVTGSMNNERSYHTATLLPEGKVLVTGGVNIDNRPVASAELYDLITGVWTVTESMNATRCPLTATLLPNGNVLAAGGDYFINAELFTLGLTTSSSQMSQISRSSEISSSSISAFILPKTAEFRINTYTNNNQMLSFLSLTLNGFLSTWTSYGQSGTAAVYGQLFNKDGVEIGAEFKVNTYQNFEWYSPASLLTNSSNVIVWSSYQGDGSYDGILGQIIDSSGTKIGDAFQANTYTNWYQGTPSVTTLHDDKFVVIWTDYDRKQIIGQIFLNSNLLLVTMMQVMMS